MRRLGLGLEEIRRALDDPSWNLQPALAAHLGDIDRRLETELRLRNRLTTLARCTATTGSITNELIALLEDLTVLETPVQKRISILVYRNIDVAFEYLTRVFSLGPGDISRDSEGRAVHGELEAGDGVVWLHPESPQFGLASPASNAWGGNGNDGGDGCRRRRPLPPRLRGGCNHRLSTRRPALRVSGIQRPRQRRRPMVIHEAT